MSSSAHVDNKKKNILILGKDPTQRLEHRLNAEKMCLINTINTSYEKEILFKFALQWSK